MNSSQKGRLRSVSVSVRRRKSPSDLFAILFARGQPADLVLQHQSCRRIAASGLMVITCDVITSAFMTVLQIMQFGPKR
jgi:hypothetical protein